MLTLYLRATFPTLSLEDNIADDATSESSYDGHMIDCNGIRPCIGIIICNRSKQLLIACRTKSRNAWQFPQGGILPDESPEEAMWRELYEELGLQPQDVKLIYSPDHWYTYYIPRNLRRTKSLPLCIGQRQKWFLLQLTADDDHISLDRQTPAEFSKWQWTDYWAPIRKVILFKRDVYTRVLKACQRAFDTL